MDDLNNVIEDPLNPEELREVMHSRGVPLRMLGKICTTAQLNHTREIAVTEVVARSAKLLMLDGIRFLSSDDENAFTGANLKKLIASYLREIFNTSVDE